MRRLRFAAVALAASVALTGCGGDQFTAAGATSGDGGGDGGIASADGGADASLATFCAQSTGHVFCDDFDRNSSDVKGAWDVVVSTGVASIVLDPSRARSAPNALFVSTKAGSQSNTSGGLQKNVGRARDYHAAFDLYVDSYADPSGQLLAFVMALDFGSSLSLSLGMQSPSAALVLESDGNGSYKSHALSRGFSPSQWVHVKVDVVLPSIASPSGSVRVSLDGASVLDDHLNVSGGATLGDAKLNVGVFPVSGTTPSPWGFRFDNVLLDHP
jgi:hypothetical protein